MTSIFYIEPELIIALNKKIIFVNPNDLQIFKEIFLPDDLTKYGLKANNNEADKQQQQEGEENNRKDKETPIVQHVAVSPNRLLIAITTAGQKALLLYQARPEHANLVSARSLSRVSSALAFSNDSNSLLVTDKTGDCYLYDCANVNEDPSFLFGHLSIVYDVLWSHDEKFILTCDRDDKIRVTNYPETYDIHGYCLGHKEFVSGLVLLTSQVIASISGDKTLRLWNFATGKQLAKAELPAPGIRIASRKLSFDKYEIAVLLHQSKDCVALYNLNETSTDNWDIIRKSVVSLPNIIPCNLCFGENERLYITGVENDDTFTIEMVPLNNGARPCPKNWINMIKDQFKEETWKPGDISVWFKKRFDNVTEYLERKKRRLEEKQK